MIVVQLGLAMMPFGLVSASSALHSGTTRGTSSSMRNALELSIMMAPCLVIVSANSLETLAPADVSAMSMSLKSSLCLSSLTVSSLPLNVYFLPALRSEPNNTSSSRGKLRCSKTRRNSCPTAPLVPTIATLILCGLLRIWRFVQNITNSIIFERRKSIIIIRMDIVKTLVSALFLLMCSDGVGQLLVTEVMATARDQWADYVEGFNASGHGEELSEDSLVVYAQSGRRSGTSMSKEPFVLMPGAYAVITRSREAVIGVFDVSNPDMVIENRSMPRLASDATLVLVGHDGATMDSVSYSQKWHDDMYVTTYDMSLERIDNTLPATLSSNWTTATAESGFATPTSENSQFACCDKWSVNVGIDGRVFVPRGDGTLAPDRVVVRCEGMGVGAKFSMSIFDGRGRLVAVPYDNVPVADATELWWDGRDDGGGMVPPGTYIIGIRIWRTDGRTYADRKTCIVAL